MGPCLCTHPVDRGGGVLHNVSQFVHGRVHERDLRVRPQQLLLCLAVAQEQKHPEVEVVASCNTKNREVKNC